MRNDSKWMKFAAAQEAQKQIGPQYEQLQGQFQNLQKLSQDQERMLSEIQRRGPGFRAVTQSEQERRAGVMPPGFEGVRDLRTGELLSQFVFDPYKGRAAQALSQQAFAEGESPWAKMQMQKQALEEAQGLDQSARNQAQAMAQAQAQMMRQGGLDSGARNRMAIEQARNMARAQQGVRSQGMGQRLGIQEQDLNRRQDLLGRFASSENEAQQRNIGQLTDDITRSGVFDVNRYAQQMQAFGAQQSADAQRAASRRGKK